jgi:hypothetical protein
METLEKKLQELEDLVKKFKDEPKVIQIKAKYSSKKKDPKRKVEELKAKHADAKEPSLSEKIAELKAKYAELGKSRAWSVQAGLQPTNEAWLAAGSQFLGLPVDAKTGEELAKQAEARWQSAIEDSFKVLRQPVETVAKSDFGRGPVDQNDLSQLTEEEKRILAIPVSDSAKS